MGLSNAISGGIIMFGLTYVIFTFGGITDKAASFSDVSSQTSDLEDKLVKTSIDITINDPPGTNPTFDFEITNTNLENYENFLFKKMFDFFEQNSHCSCNTCNNSILSGNYDYQIFIVL